MKIFINGLITGLFLQIALGPVFFYIMNLVLNKTIFDGIVAVLAVTVVDYLYITLAILGIGKLLEKKKIKKLFGVVSSVVLVVFGLITINGVTGSDIGSIVYTDSTSLLSSFASAFLLTISSPLTIIFFTGLFAAKAIEYNYTKKQLYVFGFATGLATLLFLGTSVIGFSLLKEIVSVQMIQVLNLFVGVVLIVYGSIRMIAILRKDNSIRTFR